MLSALLNDSTEFDSRTEITISSCRDCRLGRFQSNACQYNKGIISLLLPNERRLWEKIELGLGLIKNDSVLSIRLDGFVGVVYYRVLSDCFM